MTDSIEGNLSSFPHAGTRLAVSRVMCYLTHSHTRVREYSIIPWRMTPVALRNPNLARRGDRPQLRRLMTILPLTLASSRSLSGSNIYRQTSTSMSTPERGFDCMKTKSVARSKEAGNRLQVLQPSLGKQRRDVM